MVPIQVNHFFPDELRPLNLSFRGAAATKNLNNCELIRFLPTVGMTEKGVMQRSRHLDR